MKRFFAIVAVAVAFAMNVQALQFESFSAPDAVAKERAVRQGILLYERASKNLERFSVLPGLMRHWESWSLNSSPGVVVGGIGAQGGIMIQQFFKILPPEAMKVTRAPFLFITVDPTLPIPQSYRVFSQTNFAEYNAQSGNIYWFTHPISDEWFSAGLVYFMAIREQNKAGKSDTESLLAGYEDQLKALDHMTQSKFSALVSLMSGTPSPEIAPKSIRLSETELFALDDLFPAFQSSQETRFRFTTYIVHANLKRMTTRADKLAYIEVLSRTIIKK